MLLSNVTLAEIDRQILLIQSVDVELYHEMDSREKGYFT